jgi:transposase
MGAEVIEIVERRRRWSTEDKLKVMMDALEPGASIAAVAGRHGVSRNLLYTWLRLARAGRMSGLSIGTRTPSAFVPVQMALEPPISPPAETATKQSALSRHRTSTIEITLANGRVVKVDDGIDAEILARIVAVLDRVST